MVYLFTICYTRLKKGKAIRKAADIKEVEKNIHLIKSPAGMCIHQLLIIVLNFVTTLGGFF